MLPLPYEGVVEGAWLVPLTLAPHPHEGAVAGVG